MIESTVIWRGLKWDLCTRDWGWAKLRDLYCEGWFIYALEWPSSTELSTILANQLRYAVTLIHNNRKRLPYPPAILCIDDEDAFNQAANTFDLNKL